MKCLYCKEELGDVHQFNGDFEQGKYIHMDKGGNLVVAGAVLTSKKSINKTE